MATGNRHGRQIVAGGRRAGFAIWLGLVLPNLAAVPAYGQDNQPDHRPETSWRDSFAAYAVQRTENVDELADVSWRRFVNRLRLDKSHHIAAYYGYGNDERIWVRGRLLSDPPYGGPQDDDNWWDNLQATYGRWESDEIPGATVTLTYGKESIDVTTDAEGYYTATFAAPAGRARSDTVIATYESDGRLLTATHWIMLPEPTAKYLVISDMDDTVIHTGITQLLLSARLTFLSNAKTRKPLTGVAELYQAFQAGSDGENHNPIVYVSNSAWNLFDLLRDFVELNDIPVGPLLLRDIDFKDLFSKETGHKIETVQNLLDRYADLPVVLIGDTGQHDAGIYAQIVASNPGRVVAVYLRDIDPDEESEHDAAVDRVIEHSRVYDVPFLRVADSTQIAEHAVGIGLIPGSAVERVRDDASIDEKRESIADRSIIGDGS